MWLNVFKRRWQEYKLRRERNAFKSKIKTLAPLDLPKAYIDWVKTGVAPPVDRERILTTSIEDASEIIVWINAAIRDLETGSMANKVPPPGTVGRTRNVRVDKLLYDTRRSKYVDVSYIFREIVDAYATIDMILRDRTHPSHYRAKDRTMPHIETLHKLFTSIID